MGFSAKEPRLSRHLRRRWKKLLHQAFLMGLERVRFPRLRGDQLAHRTQARGDFLLFGGRWNAEGQREKCFSMDAPRFSTAAGCFAEPFVKVPPLHLF